MVLKSDKIQRHQNSIRRTQLLPKLVFTVFAANCLLALQVQASPCERVGFLPNQLTFEGAKDHQADENTNQELLDIHTFNHFYTFQVNRDVKKLNEGVEMIIPAHYLTDDQGYIFRLRTYFDSASGSRTEMGMNVFLLKNGSNSESDPSNQAGKGSSLDTEHGNLMNMVSIDIENLQPGFNYTLRYEFQAKERIHKTSLSNEEDADSTSEMGMKCHLPYFTQELAIISRKVLQKRVKKYAIGGADWEKPGNKIKNCFDHFINLDAPFQKVDIEGGFDCRSTTYFYQPKLDQQQDDVSLIAEREFSVKGVDNRPVTTYLEIEIGSEFSVSAGLIILVKRADSQFKDRFGCLMDQSCQVSLPISKNHQLLNVVLTSGEYVIQIYERQNLKFVEYIVNGLRLKDVPFQFKVEAYPILQNEERVTCPFMFMTEDFIQQKYDLMHASSGRFYFSDKIVMNLVDQVQKIYIKPTEDTMLKIVVKEAYGVNAVVRLCNQEGTTCDQTSSKIGSTSLFYKEIKKGTPYQIRIEYDHSIIAYHSFTECPHLIFELAMISTQELKVYQEQNKPRDVKESLDALDDIIDIMDQDGWSVYISEPDMGRFSFSSDQTLEFEVLWKKEFFVSNKMGFFAEIFTSPFQDEVMQLSLVSKSVTRGGELSKFKSSKSIQLELLPGKYELQIQVLRQPQRSSKPIEIVTGQLYLVYDYVNTDRAVFLPGALNFYGLFGYEQDMVNFGQHTVFFDDLEMWEEHKESMFKVATNCLLTVHLEQDRKNVHVSLVQIGDHGNGERKPLGVTTTDVNYQGGSLENIYQELEPDISYAIVIRKDLMRNEDAVEEQELGNREKSTFSLKLILTELSALKAIKVDEDLPRTFEEVTRERHSVAGIKESPFYLGTRETMHLFDELIDQADNGKIAYEPKSSKVYQTKNSNAVVARLPFKVKESERIYAGITEFTSVGLDLAIYSDDMEEEVAVSEQGKYFSLIDMAALPAGSYYLVVRNQNIFKAGKKQKNKSANSIQEIAFQLDVVRTIENSDDVWQNVFYEAIQLCPLNRSPDTLKEIGYLHPLSGGAMKQQFALSIMEIDSGSYLPFHIAEDSMVIAYVETPDDVEVALSIQSTGGVRKVVALSTDQDMTQQNFIHQKGYQQKNVVQLRQFVGAGDYWIQAQAISFNGDQNLAFDEHQNFCNVFMMYVDIQPFKSATQNINIASEMDQEDFCEGQQRLPTKSIIGEMVKGEIISELADHMMQVSYLDLTLLHEEGPFEFYFQLDYNPSQEGFVGLVLSKFDKNSNSFSEQAVYSATPGQSLILSIMDIGVYVVSVQTIASTNKKFGRLGFISHSLVNDACFRATYQYNIVSINLKDHMYRGTNSDAFLSMMETSDDLKDLQSYETCVFDKVPQKLSAPFDQQLALKVKSDKQDQIRILAEEETLIKAFVSSRNGVKDKVKLTLYAKANMTEIIAQDRLGVLTAIVPGNEVGYVLKIFYEQSSDDDCDLFDMRIAAKELKFVYQENMECKKYEMPVTELNVQGSPFRMDDTNFAFSSNYLKNYFPAKGSLQYEIKLNFPHSDYYLDVELKTDFLTTNLVMQLFMIDDDNKAHRIALSGWVNENDDGNKNVDGSSFVQRFKYLDDLTSEKNIEDSETLTIRFSIRDENLYLAKQTKDIVCFNFELSIFAKEVTEESLQDSPTNDLIRVDFQPKTIDKTSTFDITKDLFVFMEFEQPMIQLLVDINSIYDKQIESVYLVSNSEPVHRVYPQSISLKRNDANTLEMKFGKNILNRGICYKVEIDKQIASNQQHDFEICTSQCSCSTQGTFYCDEESKECVCHGNYGGSDCSKCLEGFSFDSVQEGKCVKFSKCAANGGKETCGGHGTCEQVGETALCTCDPGFANEGQMQCQRCADPLFSFPNQCDQSRNWVVRPGEHDCEELPYKMPDNLFYQGNNNNIEVVDGSLNWQGRYTLKSQYVSHQANSKQKGKINTRTKSEHKFFLQQPSVFRLYINTLNPVIRVTYEILNVEGEVIFFDNKPNTKIIAFDLINPQAGQDRSLAKDAPFTLVIKYRADAEIQQCPQVEIHFVVRPIVPHQDALQCTKSELHSAEKGNKQISLKYSDQQEINTYSIVLPSDIEVKDGNLIHKEDKDYVYLRVDLDFTNQYGNILSAFAQYKFSDLIVQMSFRKVDAEVIAVEKSEMLDYRENKDMLSYVEATNFEAGQYHLSLAIPKAFWTYTRQFQTCLNFDLTIEYIQNKVVESIELLKNEFQELKIAGVFPAFKNDMQINSELQIEVAAVNKQADYRTIIEVLSDKFKICKLSNNKVKTEWISPEKVSLRNGALILNFAFNKQGDRIQRYLNDSEGNCFSLACDFPKSHNSMFVNSQQNYKYCFSKEQIKGVTIDSCNPFSNAKFENQECVCPHPYQGALCEKCASGYEENWKNQDPAHPHTVCQAIDKDILECNGLGKFKAGQCICQRGYDGNFCDKCADETFLYPDCSGDFKSSVQSSQNLKEHKWQQREELKDVVELSIFAQECQSQDFPRDLNSLSLHKEFHSGDFHFANVYSVNSHQDNFIKFTPRAQGSFKIIIKQPSLIMDDDFETYDLTLSIYRRKGENELLVATQNSAINYFEGSAKLDFAALRVTIPQELVDENLYIVFATRNVTVVQDGKSSQNQCQQMYIEAEFRSLDNTITFCSENKKLTEQRTVKLTPSKPFLPQLASSSVVDGNSMIYQDFFIESEEQGNQLTVSLEQKFSDDTTIIPVLELIKTGLDWDDISEYQKQAPKLKCQNLCIVGEHKTYNKFTIVRDLPAGSYIRLWLYANPRNVQKKNSLALFMVETSNQICSNFQLSVQVEKKKLDQIGEESKCPIDLEYMPDTMNSEGFLGQTNQLHSFKRILKIRTDTLPRDGARTSIRTYDEPMWLRISGVQHDHIEFKLIVLNGLKEVASSSLHKVAGFGHPEPSLLVALDSDQEYTFVLEFISEPHILRQLCQNVEIQIGIMPQKKLSKVKMPDYEFKEISLQNMFDENVLFKFEASKYKGDEDYTVILSEEMTVERGTDIAIQVSSAFISADVQFALIRMDTKQVFYPKIRTDMSKSLILMNSPSRKYKLILYVRNTKNGESPSSNMPYYFAQISLFSQDRDTTTEVKLSEQKGISANVKFATIEQVECMYKSDQFINDFSILVDYEMQVNIASDFEATEYHFIASSTDLNFIINSDRFEFIVYSKDDDEISRSKKSPYFEISEMVARNLVQGQRYKMVMNYTGEKLTKWLGDKQCRILSVLISKGSDSVCTTKSSVQAPISPTFDYHKSFELPSNQTIDLDLTQTSDIEFIIDYTRELYSARLLIRKKDSKLKKPTLKDFLANDKKFRSNYLFKVGRQFVRYNNLEAGSYEVFIYYPNRPQDACEINTYVTLRSTKPSTDDFRLDNKVGLGMRISQHFQSKMENSKPLNVPTSLPLNLTSLQFLGQEPSGNLLFSEQLELSPIESENTITIEVKEDNTLIRIYFEDNTIQITWSVEGYDQAYTHMSYFQKKLSVGTHVFQFKHLTYAQQSKRADQNYLQTTIAVSQPKFFDKFSATHFKSFEKCEKAVFPLALQNNQEQSVTEFQNFYNYNSIRLPQRAERAANYAIDVTTYFFRFNETQRFYFQVASQFISSHATLTLSTARKENSFTIVGKQQGNVNIIDTILSEGDYQLKVQNYDSLKLDCGLYQFSGILNPISSMEISEGYKQVMAGVSSCAIKGDYLPEVIYSDSTNTLHGNEEYINKDGSYYSTFQNVLISSKQWTYQTEIDVLSKSILKVTIRSKVVDQMNLKLVSSSGKEQVPMLKDVVKTSVGSVKELLMMWELESSQVYYLETMRAGGSIECDYFSMFASISSIEYLHDEFKCNNDQKRFIDVIPETVGTKDMNVLIDGVFRLEYPKDFARMIKNAEVAPETENGLVLDTVINSDSSYEVKTRLWSEYALGDFTLGLYRYPEKGTEQVDELQEIDIQRPISKHQQSGDRTTTTSIGPVKATGKTILFIQERQSPLLFDLVQKKYPSEKFCLSLGVKLEITKKEDQVIKSSVPTLTEFEFVGEAQNTEDINTFGSVPLIVTIRHNQKPKDVIDSFSLALFGQGDKSLFRWKPSHVQKHTKTLTQLFFQPVVSSTDSKLNNESSFSAYLTYKNDLKSENDEDFVLSEKFSHRLENFHLTLQISKQKRVKDQIKEKNQGLQINDIKVKSKDKDSSKEEKQHQVVCACVHGSCLPNQSTCNKCDGDWSGPLCEIPKTKPKAIEMDEVDKQVFQPKQVSDQRANEGSSIPKPKKAIDLGPQITSSTTYSDTSLQEQHADEIKIKKVQEGGIVHSIIVFLEWLTEQTLYFIGLIFGLYLLVLVRNKISEQVQKYQEQARKNKRNEYEGIVATDEDFMDEDHVPIELTQIKSSKKSQVKKRGKASLAQKSYDEDAEMPKTLFDQDEMNPMNQFEPQENEYEKTSKEIGSALLDLDDDENNETRKLI